MGDLSGWIKILRSAQNEAASSKETNSGEESVRINHIIL